MRIATIGSSLALPGAEPVRYRDPAPLDGFDAVLWNPNALFAEYAPELAEDGALSVAGSQAFLADLRRRRQEMRALLDDGGSLVIEPPLPDLIRVHTLEAVLAVPLSQALPIADLAVTAARPSALRFRGGEPFRAFWERAGPDLAPARAACGAARRGCCSAIRSTTARSVFTGRSSAAGVLLLPPPRDPIGRTPMKRRWRACSTRSPATRASACRTGPGAIWRATSNRCARRSTGSLPIAYPSTGRSRPRGAPCIRSSAASCCSPPPAGRWSRPCRRRSGRSAAACSRVRSARPTC
ncbi:MAG: hypothetical protein WDO24_27545 [Pseudomonadota bacterium]